MLTAEECTLIIALIVFVFYSRSKLTQKEIQDIYYTKKDIHPKPPAELFGIVWLILDVMIVVAGYLSIKATSIGEAYYIALFVLFVVVILANDQWMIFYFENHNDKLAFFLLLFVIWPSVVTYAILCGYNGLWISCAFFIALACWLTVACVWNFQTAFLSPNNNIKVTKGTNIKEKYVVRI